MKFDIRSGIQDIRTSFTTIVRERRKETGLDFLQQQKKNSVSSPKTIQNNDEAEESDDESGMNLN